MSTRKRHQAHGSMQLLLGRCMATNGRGSRTRLNSSASCVLGCQAPSRFAGALAADVGGDAEGHLVLRQGVHVRVLPWGMACNQDRSSRLALSAQAVQGADRGACVPLSYSHNMHICVALIGLVSLTSFTMQCPTQGGVGGPIMLGCV